MMGLLYFLVHSLIFYENETIIIRLRQTEYQVFGDWEKISMSKQKDIRWKQRFENFEKAYQTFLRILEIQLPNEAEKMGLIQAFEVVFELSWKTLKDYLNVQGYQEKSPRGVLKVAFRDGMISNGHDWIEALESRNDTVHTYNDEMAEKLDKKIRQTYVSIIRDLYLYLKDEYDNE